MDADKVLDSALLKSTYRKVMSKVQQLWNLQSCSMVVADTILDILGRLVVPNSTKWISTHDSVGSPQQPAGEE